MKKQDVEVKKAAEEPPPAPQPEAKQYSTEFLDMMMDYAYEALRQHMAAVKADPTAREMLENIMVLHTIRVVYCHPSKVTWIWNQNAGETIGHISKLVIAMGGRFAPAPMDMIKA
ncbi:MAG TPA: hypothetical protein VFY83_08915 [Anaerolineales bacterium]|nr:hypothetical protein [Anaerolineales bacterium]